MKFRIHMTFIYHMQMYEPTVWPKKIVKLWFSNMHFVGFYSVPNLIVILFNLMYPVFVVGIYCKGCVIVRGSVKT